MFSSLRASATFALLAALVPLGCDEAPDDLVGTDAEATLDQQTAQTAQASPPKGIFLPNTQAVPVQLGLSGADVANRVHEDWPGFWGALRLGLDPSFDGQVQVFAALVDERGFTIKSSFVSEPFSLDGGDDGTFLSQHVPAPDSRYPTPDQWQPGSKWVSGSELTGGDRLVPVSSLLGGNGWYPEPDQWFPAPDDWYPEPDSWVVTGIVDGIPSPAQGATSSGPRTLVIGVPVGSEPGSSDHAGGVVVFFHEK